MKFWLEFFKDKRFSWDFKIANFIMRDSLRNYFAVDMVMLKEISNNNKCTNSIKRRIDKIAEDLNMIMHK